MGTINEETGITTSPVSAGSGSAASDTGTAVGENAQATDEDTSAYGRNAEATDRDATAIGANALAPALWNTVLGEGAGQANNGDFVTIVGRNGTATGDRAVVVGENAAATGNDATAIGHTATAGADGAVAIGVDTDATVPNSVSVGDRDRELRPGRSLVFGENTDVETLADMVIDGDLAAGDPVSYDLQIGGTAFLRVRAEADGAGGIQNPSVYIPQDLAVDGQTTEVEDVVTGSVTAGDGGGNVAFSVDATTATPSISFHGTTVTGVSRLVADGTQIEIEGDLVVSGEVSENQTL